MFDSVVEKAINGKFESSSKDVEVAGEVGKSLWDVNFDYEDFVAEHFAGFDEDMAAGDSGAFERVARDSGMFGLWTVVLMEVLGKKYQALKKQEALLKEVSGWKGKATDAEEKLKAALADKKTAEDAKNELEEEVKTLKDGVGVKDQKIAELEEDLHNEKMESALSFYNGFNRARSQAEFLCKGADFSRMSMDKVVEGDDLVVEVEPVAGT